MFSPHPPRPGLRHRRLGATALALLLAAVMAVPAGLGHHTPGGTGNQLGEQDGLGYGYANPGGGTNGRGFKDHGFSFEGIPRGVDPEPASTNDVWEWPPWCRNGKYMEYAGAGGSYPSTAPTPPGPRAPPPGQPTAGPRPWRDYTTGNAPPVGDILGVESVREVDLTPGDPAQRVAIARGSGNLFHVLEDAGQRIPRGWEGPEPGFAPRGSTDEANGTLLGPDGWVVGRLQAPVFDEPLAYDLWVNDNDNTNDDSWDEGDGSGQPFGSMPPNHRRASYCVWGRPSFDDQGPWLFIGTGFPAQGDRWRGGAPYGTDEGSPLDLSLWYHDAYNARYGDPTGPELTAEVQDILIQGAHERFPAVRAWFDYNVSDTDENSVQPYRHGYDASYSTGDPRVLVTSHMAEHKEINEPDEAITYRNPDPNQWSTEPYITYPYAYNRTDPMPIVQEHWVSFDQFAERFGWPYDPAWGDESQSGWDELDQTKNQTYNNRPDPMAGTRFWYFDTDPRPRLPEGENYTEVGPPPGVPVDRAPYGTLDAEWDGPIWGADHENITLIHVDRGDGLGIDLFYLDRDANREVSEGDVRLTEFLDHAAGSVVACPSDITDDDDCGWGDLVAAVAADGADPGIIAGDSFLDSFWMKAAGTPPDNVGIGDFRIHHDEETDRVEVRPGDRDAPIEGDHIEDVTRSTSVPVRWMDLKDPSDNVDTDNTSADVDSDDGFYIDVDVNGKAEVFEYRIRHRDLQAGTIEWRSNDRQSQFGSEKVLELPDGVHIYRANATNGWPDGDLRDAYYLSFTEGHTRVTADDDLVRLHHPDWRPNGTGSTAGILPDMTEWSDLDLKPGQPGYRRCGGSVEPDKDGNPYADTYYWPECYDDFPYENRAETLYPGLRVYYDDPDYGGDGEYDVCMLAYSQTAQDDQDIGLGDPTRIDRWNSDLECQTITVTNIPPVALLTEPSPPLAGGGNVRERTFLGTPFDPDGRDPGYGNYPECIDEYIWQFDDESGYTLGWDHRGDPKWPKGLMNPTYTFESGGPKRVAFTVRDCNGVYSEPAVRYVKLPPNEPPVFGHVAVQKHTADSRFCFAVRAWDPEAQPLRSLTHDGVPAGATPASTEGNTDPFNFCWTPRPADVGKHLVVFRAVDSLDAETTLRVPIEVRLPSLDTDGDGSVDVADACPAHAESTCDGNLVGNGGTAWRPVDEDGDGIPDGRDFDGDGKADTLIDEDGDGIPDGVDVDGDGAIDFTLDLDTAMELAQASGANARDLLLRGAAEATSKDTDDDGVVDALDNCPRTPNAGQGDLDADGIGDLCDADVDGDGIVQVSPLADTHLDNCPYIGNPGQADGDGDGIGDLCDSDSELGRSNLAKLDSRRLTAADCDDCGPRQVPDDDAPDTQRQRFGTQGVVGMVAGVAVLILVSLGLTMWAVRRWR